MQRCLAIEEIVRQICSQLCPYEEGNIFRAQSYFKRRRYYSLASLSAMARTCKAFCDPALDVLWECAHLSHLLRYCMPGDLWDVNRHGSASKYELRPLRPIEFSDCERLRTYAPRVKHLKARDELVDPLIFGILGLDLLRHIRSLEWYCPGDDFDVFHRVLLSNALTTIHLKIRSGADTRLSSLAVRHPQLKNIRIEPPHPDDGRLPAVSTFLCALQCVEKVSVPSLNHEALDHLASLPNLKSLDKVYSLPEQLSERSRGIRAFPALNILSFHSTESTANQLLRWCTAVPLTHLDIGIKSKNTLTGTQIHNLFICFPVAVLHSSLSSIVVNTDSYLSDFATDRAECLILKDSIRALCCFQNLKTLRILSAVGVDLDDSTMYELTVACPRLKILQFRSRFALPSQPQATLQCLRYLARHCNSLAEVTLTLDATVLPDPEEAATPPQRSLVYLNVLSSPILNSRPVAQLLSLFPNLKCLSTRTDYDTVDEVNQETAALLRQAAIAAGHEEESKQGEDEEEGERDARAYYSLWKEVASSIPGCILHGPPPLD